MSSVGLNVISVCVSNDAIVQHLRFGLLHYKPRFRNMTVTVPLAYNNRLMCLMLEMARCCSKPGLKKDAQL